MPLGKSVGIQTSSAVKPPAILTHHACNIWQLSLLKVQQVYKLPIAVSQTTPKQCLNISAHYEAG